MELFGGNNQETSPMPQDQNQPQPEEIISETELISFVDKEFKRRQEERRPYELQWRLNIAFLEGNQYLDINPFTMTLEEAPVMYWWQEREVFNHLAPLIETRIAKLSRMRPILKTRPGSNEQADIRAAKVGSQLLKNIYYDQGAQKKAGTLNVWMESCGSAFTKNIWDPNKGSIVAQMPNKQGALEEVREGDLDYIVCPPQEIYPDSPYRQDVQYCRSIIHARAYHVDEIEEIWGQKVTAEETDAMQLQKSMIGTGGLGYGQGGFYLTNTRLKDHAVVKEYWELPSKKFPKGRIIITAGKKLLYFDKKLPYPIGDDGKPALPFNKVDCIERPGVFWGKTVVERMIPVQRRYNALRNRKAEYLNRAAIGQWLVMKESVDPDVFEQDCCAPGAIHEYERGSEAPRMVETPPLPAAFETELSALLQEMSMISGVSELSRQSNAPPGVKSGVALSIALEQDDTRLSSTAANIEQFLVSNGKQWLRFYKAFVPGVRTLRAVGKNNVVELMDWTGADIRSDDVMIESFSALAESPAQRRQMVFDLLQTPLFQDPDTGRISKETRAKIMEIIEMGNWETIDDDDELHINKAERENRQLAQGVMVNAAHYDDHIIHISRLNKFRLTTDYEELLAQFPQIEQMFNAHEQMHMMLLAQQAQTAQQVAMAQAINTPGGGEGAA